MSESKNICIEDNKNIIKPKDINYAKYSYTEEGFNLKLEQSVNNANNFNSNIIPQLIKKISNYKKLSICLINIIVILLIILSIILYKIIYNFLQNKKNNKSNISIFYENKNSSIFDIIYNDIIFDNYISGDFFSNLSNSKTIFYVNTYDLDKEAWNITKNYTVLITHSSDLPINSSKFDKFLQCGKFKYWFAQNPVINEPRLFALPIGLMNKIWHIYPRFNLMMKEKMKNIKPTKLLLLSFSIQNNKKKRQQCADSFINKTYATNNAVNHVDYIGDAKEYDRNYFNIMLDHLFIACPEGYGVDTHRFWETLYMGRYPVVLHNRVNDAFIDLPVLILNKWEDFENEYLIFLERIKNKKFSYKKLTQEYWIDRINNLE